MSIKIRNWNKFQHYGDSRRPIWIKLYRELLDDVNWHELDPLAAKCLVMMWLIASENDGNLPETKALAFRLRISERELKALLPQLNNFLVQDASKLLAESYQDASLYKEEERDKEKEIEKEVPLDRRSTRPKKGCRLPVDWMPKDFIEETYELEKFRDYWASVSGQRGVKLDWDATWRNWVKSAKERRPAKKENYLERIARTTTEIINEQGTSSKGRLDSFGLLPFGKSGRD
jgi:hypothetical protein